MELTGLTLGQVLAVLGGFGAAVVVLYLLKLRRRQVQVPFVKLWETVLAEKQTTRLFSKLKRLLSLLIALAIVAALAFALGDPRWVGSKASGRTLVVLVDASASMKATDEEPTRFDRAKAEVRRIADGLGPSDRMIVAQMDATTTPISPLTGDPRVVLESLGALHATDVTANLRAGVRFARDVLRDQPGPEVVVLSDGRLEDVPESERALAGDDIRLSWVKIGRRGRNVAITAFSVRRYPLDKSQSEVLVELWNPTAGDEAIELTLLGDGQPIDVQRVTVHGEERLRRFFRNISGVDKTLEARITLANGGHDDLPADDRAYARLPERRRARVLSVTSGNLYLSAALLLDEYLEVTEIPPAQYPAPGRWDVVIFDNFVPSAPPATNALYLHPSPAPGVEGPLEVAGTLSRPFFERIDRRHPLTKWTALGDVNVADALEVRPGAGDRVVAGDARGPLIVEGTRSGRRFVAFTFDVRRSDLPLRVAWPLLLLNTIDWFVQEEAGYLSSYPTGETWYVPAPPGAERAMVVDPFGDEREVPVVEGRAVYAGTEAGFYTIRAGDREDTFAANLGPGEESDIAPVDRLVVAGRTAASVSASRAGVRQELWIYLVLAVIGILLVEWFTYHRRYTV